MTQLWPRKRHRHEGLATTYVRGLMCAIQRLVEYPRASSDHEAVLPIVVTRARYPRTTR